MSESEAELMRLKASFEHNADNLHVESEPVLKRQRPLPALAFLHQLRRHNESF